MTGRGRSPGREKPLLPGDLDFSVLSLRRDLPSRASRAVCAIPGGLRWLLGINPHPQRLWERWNPSSGMGTQRLQQPAGKSLSRHPNSCREISIVHLCSSGSFLELPGLSRGWRWPSSRNFMDTPRGDYWEFKLGMEKVKSICSRAGKSWSCQRRWWERLSQSRASQ